MKRSILFICLFFLPFSTTVYASEDIEDQLNALLAKEETCTDISELSKQLNELEQTIYSQIDTLTDQNEQFQSKIQSLKKKQSKSQQEYNKLQASISIYMKLYQCGESSAQLDQYNEYQLQIHSCRKQIKKLEKKLLSNNESLEAYQNDLVKIEQCQQRLFERSSFEEYNNEGNFNEHQTIHGTENLPVYGGYYSNMNTAWQACLEAGGYAIDSYSASWIHPIPAGYVSAGTWAYPNGDMHLGLDVACPLYSDVVAPANGIILYADSPVDSDCGYLGNFVGWPLGGGNTICMIVAVNDALYGVTFAHLSQDIYVQAGQQVEQGSVLALSGNSGNSTGPHCHIEVFSLNCSLEEAVSYFIQGADFTFGNGFDEPETCSSTACRIRPESIWG